MRIDFQETIRRTEVFESFSAVSRLILGKAGDGWNHTAALQEFSRDLGRPRSDRPEIFVWEESLRVEASSLYLMADVEPEATPVPEIIDAIRHLANPGMPIAECTQVTDTALRLGQFEPAATFLAS